MATVDRLGFLHLDWDGELYVDVDAAIRSYNDAVRNCEPGSVRLVQWRQVEWTQGMTSPAESEQGEGERCVPTREGVPELPGHHPLPAADTLNAEETNP